MPPPNSVSASATAGATHRRLRRQVLQAARNFVRFHGLWRAGDRIVLACSGGADSMAALDLLDGLQGSLGHRLVIAHVDHGIRSDSAQAWHLVQQTAQGRGLPVHGVRLNLEPGADLEGRARTARYAALHDILLKTDAHCVVTAHHADDQAETFLLRASRGAGLPALVGIRKIREDWLIRPFLTLSGKTLRESATPMPIAWDSSNADSHFSRNAIRLHVLPVLEQALPGAAAGIARTANHLAEFEGQVQRWMHLAMHNRLTVRGPEAAIDLSDLPLEPADWGPLLHWLASRLEQPGPDVQAVATVAAWWKSESDLCCHIHGFALHRRGRELVLHAANVARGAGAD